MPNTDINAATQTSTKITEPGMFEVIILNDDVTPVEFVIALLMTVFGHSQDYATDLTYKIHHDGSAVAGVYNYEISEQKGFEAIDMSRAHGFPLQVKVKPE